jgi:hypothetical protein
LDPSYHMKNEIIRGGTPKEKRSTEQWELNTVFQKSHITQTIVNSLYWLSMSLLFLSKLHFMHLLWCFLLSYSLQNFLYFFSTLIYISKQFAFLTLYFPVKLNLFPLMQFTLCILQNSVWFYLFSSLISCYFTYINYLHSSHFVFSIKTNYCSLFIMIKQVYRHFEIHEYMNFEQIHASSLNQTAYALNVTKLTF